jgi:hypothetical protein
VSGKTDNAPKTVNDQKLKGMLTGCAPAVESLAGRGTGAMVFKRPNESSPICYYRYHLAGKQVLIKLGTYSRTTREAGFTLPELRDKAAEMARIAKEHGDVKAHLASLEADKEAARLQAKRQGEIEAERGTFGEMLDAYIEHLAKAGKASAGKVKSLFKVNVFEAQPALTARYANEIRPEDITHILDDTLERKPKARGIGNKAKAPAANLISTADELRRYLRTAFNFAAASHLAAGQRGSARAKTFCVNSNPAMLIPVISGAGGGKTKSLTPSEFAELLRHLDTLPERRAAIAKAAIYFGGQRIKQLLSATWDSVSGDTLSLLDAKGKKTEAWEHLLPITPRISEIIAPLLADQIAPGPFALTPGKLAHKDTISRLFSDAGSALALAGKAQAFSWLQVRATVETLLAAQGVSSEVRAWLLSHGRNGVQSKHYDRYSYLPEKRAALEQWGRYLDKLRDGSDTTTDNVVLLSRRT